MRVHEQQLTIEHIGFPELIARREELEASLKDKRRRLQAAKDSAPERGYAGSREARDKREAAIILAHQLSQQLEKEIKDGRKELARLNSRIQALNLPYGTVGAMSQVERQERRKKR